MGTATARRVCLGLHSCLLRALINCGVLSQSLWGPGASFQLGHHPLVLCLCLCVCVYAGTIPCSSWLDTMQGTRPDSVLYTVFSYLKLLYISLPNLLRFCGLMFFLAVIHAYFVTKTVGQKMSKQK